MVDALRVALPTGLGDAHWCVQKLRALKALHPGRPLHAETARTPWHESWNYLKLVPFIDSACEGKHLASVDELKPRFTDPHWTKLENCKGWKGFDYVLCANGHLETGGRIEDFLPELATDYTYPLSFQSECHYPGSVVLYPSGVGPNSGFHGNWWTQEHWRKTIRLFAEAGVTPVIVGASTKQDMDYAKAMLSGVESLVTNLVGKTSTDEVLHLISKAKLWMGLNSGLGILSAMMGTPTIMHWSVKPFGKLHPAQPYSWLEERQLSRYRVFAYGDPGFTPHALLAASAELSALPVVA